MSWMGPALAIIGVSASVSAVVALLLRRLTKLSGVGAVLLATIPCPLAIAIYTVVVDAEIASEPVAPDEIDAGGMALAVVTIIGLVGVAVSATAGCVAAAIAVRMAAKR